MHSPRSLRIPSAFCGLYTIRPSYERLPYCNAVNSQEGQESVSSVLGPMTNSLSGVRIFVKAILDARPWRKDPLCIRKEWSEREYALGDHGGRGGKLCFAVMWDNGVIKPHPPLLRALEMAKKALKEVRGFPLYSKPMVRPHPCRLCREGEGEGAGGRRLARVLTYDTGRASKSHLRRRDRMRW